MTRLISIGFCLGVIAGVFGFINQALVTNQSCHGAKFKTQHTLTGSFKLKQSARERDLICSLGYANKGTTIHITITRHSGGYNATAHPVMNAVTTSKANVVITVKGFIASNAALLYRYGNTAIVYKNSRILYHQHNGGWVTTSWSRTRHNIVHAFEFMTKNQRKGWENKRDIIVSGATVCRSRFVISDHGNYCVIRGIK